MDRSDGAAVVRVRPLLLGMGLAVLIVLAALVWVGVRAFLAKDQLTQVLPAISTLRSASDDVDLDRLSVTVDSVADPAARAARLTSDPLWQGLEPVPVIGDDLHAARVSADVVDTLVGGLAQPVLHELTTMAGTHSGTLDPHALARMSGTVGAAADALDADRAQLRTLNTAALLPPLEDGVTRLRPVVEQLTPVLEQAHAIGRVGADLLGADGPRTIVVAVQNNAELRTGGGITGAFIGLKAHEGMLSLERVASDAEFGSPGSAVAEVPAATTTLYGDAVGRHVQNTTMAADFAVTGRLTSAWWQQRAGQRPDAVLAIDPVVLAALLEATGPVTLPDGTTLTADNAVQTLLVDAYLTREPEEQDELFAQAATAVFDHIDSGALDPSALVGALRAPLADGRISLWSADPAQQKLLADTTVGGPAARHRLAGPGAFAVYLNDATGAKMDSFLSVAIDTGSAVCRADGHRDVTVDVRLANTAPADAAHSLPGVMTGWGLSGVPEGRIATKVTVAAPPGSFLGGVRVGDRLVGARDAELDGFPTAETTLTLAPGSSRTVQFRFIVDSESAQALSVLHTPTIGAVDVGTAPLECR